MNNTKNVHCRLCAELKPPNELTNLQTDVETCQKVVNKLSRFNIVMDFQENILPKTVCLICVKSLERAFTFVTAVEQAQVLLSDYIMIQIRTVKNDTYGEHSFYVPSDIGSEMIDIKVEKQRNPMDLNDDDSSNVDAEGYYDETKVTAPPSGIIEEKINIKNEKHDYIDINIIEDNKNINVGQTPNLQNDCREKHDSNVTENDYKGTFFPEFKNIIVKESTLEIELVPEPNPPLYNFDYHTDKINKQDDSSEGTNTMGTGGQQVEPIPVPIPSKILDTTLYSEEYLNKQISRLGAIPVQCLKTTWMDYEWKCSYCGTVFANIQELQTHSMLYHNSCNSYQCTDCKIKKQRLNAFIKHVRSHRKYLHYSCYRCFEKFPNMMDTLQHKAKIHENSKHICLGCNSPFPSNAELEEHVNKYYKILWKRKTFIINEDLTCTTCKKVCTNVTSLKKHLDTHKEKKRDRLCDRCGKCFDSDPNLRVHMETHTERVLYHCEICKTTFKTVYSLRYHASVHTGVKPFACDICSKRFRNKQQIQNHMKHHSDYFPFACTVCSKKFRTDTRLQNHMLQHTGEKPFSCDICPRDFTNLSNRNKHMRRKHGIEMAKRRQTIIKQQTTEDMVSSDLATGDAIYADLDKMNEWKNKMIEQQKSKMTNKIKKSKVISKECSEN